MKNWRDPPEEIKDAAKAPFVLVLDNLRSMNNVGSNFRTADAFLCEKIIFCGITAKPPHREIQDCTRSYRHRIVYKKIHGYKTDIGIGFKS